MTEYSYTNRLIKEKNGGPVVTLEQAKAQLIVEHSFVNDDEHILQLINAATGAAEDFIGADIAPTDNTLEFIRFGGQSIQVLEANFNGDIEIEKTVDGITEIVPPSDYEIHERRVDFTIYFKDHVEADKLVLRFGTGFQVGEAPLQIQQAILIKVNDLYDLERTSFTIGTNYRENKAFERLLSSFVINRW